MKHVVTRITQENKKFLVEIDGVYHLFLYARDLRKQSLKGLISEKSELTDDDVKMLNELVINRGRKRIMYLLGKQDYPKSKLSDKLLKEHYIEVHIKEILEPFETKGFINDEKLLKRRVEGFKSYKSKREIEFKLKNSGFENHDIKEALNASFSNEDELVSALKLLNKRFFLKRFKLEETELKKKALGYLSRKGYPTNICFKAFDMFINEEKVLNNDDFV